MPHTGTLLGFSARLGIALAVQVVLYDVTLASSVPQDSLASSSQESTAEGEQQAPLFAISTCTDAMIRELLASSVLTEEEQEAIWIAFREYKAIAEQCVREGNVALHEAGLADRAALRELAIYRDDAGRRQFRPSDDPIWGQWRELEMNLNNCVIPHRRRHDATLRLLLDRISSIYEQGDIFIPQPRVFLLRLLRGKRPERLYDYAMENVDLNELVRQSLATGVLGEVSDQLSLAPIDGYTTDQFRYDLSHALHSYNVHCEQDLISRVLPPVKLTTIDRPGLVPSPITPDLIERMSRNGKRWRSQYNLTKNHLQQLIDVVRQIAGDDAARQFEHEYNLALCPAVFKQRWPHTMTDWLRSKRAANDDLVSAAEQIEQEFAARYEVLQNAAFQAGVEACSKLGTTVVSFGDDVEAHARFDEALLAMQLEGRRAIHQLHALLPPELQTELRDVIGAGDSTMAGPYRVSKYFNEEQRRLLGNWPGFAPKPTLGDIQ